MDEDINQVSKGPCPSGVTSTVPSVGGGDGSTADPITTVSTTQSYEDIVHGSEVCTF